MSRVEPTGFKYVYDNVTIFMLNYSYKFIVGKAFSVAYSKYMTHSGLLDYSKERLGKPIANIKYNPSDSNSFNRFMWVLLSGQTISEQNISTIYPVKNDNDFEFYYVENSPGSASLAGGTYFPESNLAYAKEYYENISNYDTQNLVCKYAVYTDSESQSGIRHDAPYIDIEKRIVLKSEIFETISQLFNSEKTPDRVKIPEKYHDIDNAAIPGTPIFGYDERKLYAYSKDSMAFKHVYLVLIENQVYAEVESGSGYISGYPLPNDINQYIIDTVFAPLR